MDLDPNSTCRELFPTLPWLLWGEDEPLEDDRGYIIESQETTRIHKVHEPLVLFLEDVKPQEAATAGRPLRRGWFCLLRSIPNLRYALALFS